MKINLKIFIFFFAWFTLTASFSFAKIDKPKIDSTATVYNFTVQKNHTYYVGKGNFLVHNDCKAIAKVLEKLSESNQAKFLQDFKDNQSLLNKFANGQIDIEAWSILKTSYDNADALHKNSDALLALTKIRKNSKFTQLGLTDEILGKIRGYGTGTFAASYAEIINDLDKFGNYLNLNPTTSIENFSFLINTLKRTDAAAANYKQGVHWIIQDLNLNGDIFKGKKIKFEHSIPNARPTNANSSIDLFCIDCTPANLKIEYKSGPGSIESSTIKDQFIERDLFNANSLDEIQWRMKQTNFSKETLTGYLTNNRTSIERLGFEKINKLLGKDYDVLTPVSTLSDAIINYFSNQQNYFKIFK